MLKNPNYYVGQYVDKMPVKIFNIPQAICTCRSTPDLTRSTPKAKKRPTPKGFCFSTQRPFGSISHKKKINHKKRILSTLLALALCLGLLPAGAKLLPVYARVFQPALNDTRLYHVFVDVLSATTFHEDIHSDSLPFCNLREGRLIFS